DYMSSAGIRSTTPAAAQTGPGRERPAGEGGGGESGRRESPAGPRKPPLPPVAAPLGPPRPGGAPRPRAPRPLARNQRAEKSMTKEEMFALMKSGQLGGAHPAAGRPGFPGSGSRGGQIQRGGAPAAGAPRVIGPAPAGGGALRRGPAIGAAPGPVAV